MVLDDGLPTPSSHEQHALETRVVEECLAALAASPEDLKTLQLNRDDHVQYLKKGLQALPPGFVALDASRPWLCFWILHSLALLDAPLRDADTPTPDMVVQFLKECQHPTGGFGGGPQQLPHLATTYAAIASLLTLGGPTALSVIDRQGLQNCLRSCCVPAERGGGMVMHQGGEVDVRGCYTALAAAHMVGIDKQDLANRGGLVDFIRRCQTYEGGIGGEPNNEAHGGYTYCGLAALMLLGKVDVLDIPRLLHWLVYKQGTIEGGFAGRTNKLVDGCYTFWQGALLPLVHALAPHYFAQTGPLAGPQTHSPGAPADETASGVQNSKAGSDAVTERAKQLAQDMEIRILALPPSVDRGPAAQAVAASERLQAELQVGSSHVFPSDVSPPNSLPMRPNAIMERTQQYREMLQQGALASTDAQASTVMQQQDPQHAQQPGEGQTAGQTDGQTDSAQHAQQTLCNCSAVQLWVLGCCQGLRGLRDKPGKAPDYYHTCYCLSGLSAIQYYQGVPLGAPGNRLRRADLLCNVLEEKLVDAREYFAQQGMELL